MAEAKPPCKYGSQCYRKNPDHLNRYYHPMALEEDGAADDSDSASAVARDPGEHAPLPIRTKRGRDEDNSCSPDLDTKKTKLTDTANVKEDDTKKTKLIDPANVEEDEPSTSSSSVIVTLPPHTSFTQSSYEDPSKPAQSGSEDQIINSNVGEKLAEQDQRDSEEVDLAEAEFDRECGDEREKIRRKFLVDMPEDFYQFWEFCQSIAPSHPENALISMGLDMELVGPYHVLCGRLDGRTWEQCVLHFRYFYDPPEMVTVLRRTDDQFHLGYFRDSPEMLDESFIVSNDVSKGCEIKIEAQNLFAAVKFAIEKSLKSHTHSASEKRKLGKLGEKLSERMEELKLDSPIDPKILSKRRNKVVQAKCLHKIGIVVPYDKKTDVGYRSLPRSDREIVKLLDSISKCTDPAKRDQMFEPVQEMVTYVQFANDECDYGMGLELGLDLFCHGGDGFHGVVSHLLPLAYNLLERPQYGRIIEKHLLRRELSPMNVCTSID